MSNPQKFMRQFRDRLTGSYKRNTPVNVVEAYDEWAKTYDAEIETGNLTVFYNDQVVSKLLSEVEILNKTVCDFGAGTGRHLGALKAYSPERLIACDVSPGMLEKLGTSHTEVERHLLTDHQLSFAEDETIDVLFSSLTIGHIAEISAVFQEWSRVLIPNGTIVLTMFHPELTHLEKARSFVNQQGKVKVIESYVHDQEKLYALFDEYSWKVIKTVEQKINEQANEELQRINKPEAFERLFGQPLILGFILKKVI